ncbi:MAG: DUF2764 family protein [Thermodesulfobacteriota bacterium]
MRTLLTSLPGLPAGFEMAHVPISRIGLEKRLTMVDDRQRLILATFLRFWADGGERPQEQFMQLYRQLFTLLPAPALAIFLSLCDIRMLAAAVRSRAQGRNPPPAIGNFGGDIIRLWKSGDFGMGRRFPWLFEFRSLVEGNRVLQAERKINGLLWETARRLGEMHLFDLEAALCYLVRWQIIRRWTARDANAGRKTFLESMAAARQQYGAI